MIATRPRKIQNLIPVLTTAYVPCWIISVHWIETGPAGMRCTLCGQDIAGQHVAMIRYKPIESRDAISLSERSLRACSCCAATYSEPPAEFTACTS